ncbi:hypothetical protein LRHMDP2_1663 [Lacticaseibacillus rhamnosus LRHMDP2]|uniref:Uncharacterized protein n=1 Tax=Lacticaseibacillus rhamnosus LRHMDP3 TaxID=1203259 RepID=A0AB33XSM4_LACRH|nr:hypothetical protein LRHMDP3_2015 [Lacticaseibacillus rhamnosus LRHMDP3]EKS51258.1 hypothetical protein LRHMDP2_1663 [Lacticaseibacillus rhamnosus LRHMDP2]
MLGLFNIFLENVISPCATLFLNKLTILLTNLIAEGEVAMYWDN